MSKLYDDRDILGQGEFYLRHASAMTREGLRSKADIAAELAHRDMIIDEMRDAIDAVRTEGVRLRQELDGVLKMIGKSDG